MIPWAIISAVNGDLRLGIALFVLLFEARARYLFTYVPLYILIACGSTKEAWEQICKRVKYHETCNERV